MSEQEKSTATSALDALAKLAEAKGAGYVNGLVDGINLGTADQKPEPQQ